MVSSVFLVILGILECGAKSEFYYVNLVQFMGKQLVDKRKLQPAGRAIKASAKNRTFKVRHGLQYSGKKTADAQRGFGPRLRAVQQLPYESILKMNQGAAKKVLLQAGVLPSNVKTLSFAYWCCHTKNAMMCKIGFRCQEKGCSVGCRVMNAEVAFMPVFHIAAGGCDPDYRELLRVSYLIGSKVSNDQAIHFLRTLEQSLDMAMHRVKILYLRFRLCLAWTEKVVADKTQYERELVEIDSSRICVKKCKGPSAASSNSTNLGRTSLSLADSPANGPYEG